MLFSCSGGVSCDTWCKLLHKPRKYVSLTSVPSLVHTAPWLSVSALPDVLRCISGFDPCRIAAASPDARGSWCSHSLQALKCNSCCGESMAVCHYLHHREKHVVLLHGGSLKDCHEMRGYRMAVMYYENKLRNKDVEFYDSYMQCLRNSERLLKELETRLGIERVPKKEKNTSLYSSLECTGL